MNQISLKAKKKNPIIIIIFLFLWVMLSLSFSKASAAPIITAPTSSSGLNQTTETFSWSANGTTGILQWWVYFGNTGIGSSNIYTANQLTNTSASISGLPGDGNNLNLRLWYKLVSGWSYEDFTCVANNGCTTDPPVAITSPINGSIFTHPSQIFNWQSTGGTVIDYWLYIGTTGAGSTNIFNNGSLGTATQITVNNLPTNGSLVYVRLWYFIGGWGYIDHTYTSCSGCVISPIITLKKNSAVISDGINTTNPKRIPGAIIEYTITATNSGFGTADSNSIVINDSIPADTDYEAGTLQFLNNTSGLNPIATLNDSGGNIQVTPQGTFSASSGAGDPSFQVKFKVKVK